MPKVSIILPVYNGEDYLLESIQSVINQTFQDWELIIVDDGSSDSSPAIAQEYSAKDSRIRFVKNDQNIKLPATLNRGFRDATGDLWTWTSCDNAYHPGAIEILVEAFHTHPSVGLVYSSMNLIDNQGSITGHVAAGPASDLIMRNVVGACFMYRAQIASEVGTYNPNCFLCEDYEYWLRIAKKSPILPVDATLYNYRRHNKSLSAEREKEIIARGIKVQKQYYADFIHSRRDAARFYAYLRARDIHNPFRQFYILYCLYYNPCVFINELCGLIKRRFIHEKN